MAGHVLVRLIDGAVERGDADPLAWGVVDVWLEDRCDDPVPLLIELATDRSLLREKALAGGEVSIAATYLLERYGDARAVKPLLGLLCSMPRSRSALLQWNAIWEVLHGMADDAVRPAIELYRRSDAPRHRAILATLLGDLRATDKEVYEILAAELTTWPCLMATYLGAHGDRRALPFLLEMFDAVSWSGFGEFDIRFVGQPMLDLCDAITALSGALSSRQWETYMRAWNLRAPAQPPPSIVPPPGREKQPEHISQEPAVMITAFTSTEFHQSALTMYGTLRNTAAKIGATPAMVHHSACTMAAVA